jgi:hypothetical protein
VSVGIFFITDYADERDCTDFVNYSDLRRIRREDCEECESNSEVEPFYQCRWKEIMTDYADNRDCTDLSINDPKIEISQSLCGLANFFLFSPLPHAV